ncbi:MAG: hypothetical protein O3A63_13465 [Proteobacteria bacterium]|nr:hypothetical protein [Pseudomonadota bacterium]
MRSTYVWALVIAVGLGLWLASGQLKDQPVVAASVRVRVENRAAQLHATAKSCLAGPSGCAGECFDQLRIQRQHLRLRIGGGIEHTQRIKKRHAVLNGHDVGDRIGDPAFSV